jgi:chromosome segregation ATPase
MSESIASLRRRKDDLTAEKRDIERRMKFDRAQLDSLDSRISSIRKQIKGTHENLTVSDHAMLRYIDRALQMDTETMKKAIVSCIEDKVKSLGDGEYPLLGAVPATAIVKGGVVVTIVTKGDTNGD